MRFIGLVFSFMIVGCSLEPPQVEEGRQPMPSEQMVEEGDDIGWSFDQQPKVVTPVPIPGFYCNGVEHPESGWVTISMMCDGLYDCRNGADENLSNCQDDDEDGVPARLDNCPGRFNPAQSDIDNDGYGDPCDNDRDGDETVNLIDPCPDQEVSESTCLAVVLLWCYVEPVPEEWMGWASRVGMGRGEIMVFPGIPMVNTTNTEKCASLIVPDEISEVFVDATVVDHYALFPTRVDIPPVDAFVSRDGWLRPVRVEIGEYDPSMMGFRVNTSVF